MPAGDAPVRGVGHAGALPRGGFCSALGEAPLEEGEVSREASCRRTHTQERARYVLFLSRF